MAQILVKHYPDYVLRCLGLRPTPSYFSNPDYIKDWCPPDSFLLDDNPFIDRFREVIRILYSNNKGLYPDFSGYLNRPDTPQLVKDFVSNVLMVELPSMPSAPDDDTAFNSIIPRASTISEYRYQIENLVQYFKDNPLSSFSESGQLSDGSSNSD